MNDIAPLQEGSSTEAVAADYSFFAERTLWTIFDASCLIYGVQPPTRGKTKERLAAIPESARGRIEVLYGDAKDAIELDVLKYESNRDGNIANVRVKPAAFIAWARSRGVAIPHPLESLADKQAAAKELGDRERNNLYRVIGMLHQIVLYQGIGAKARDEDFKNRAELIEYMVEHGDDLEGISKRNLDGLFPKALQALNQDQDQD